MRRFIVSMFLLFAATVAQASVAVFSSGPECQEAVMQNVAAVYQPAPNSPHYNDHPINGSNIVLWQPSSNLCGRMEVARSVATLPHSEAWVYLPRDSRIRRSNTGAMFDDRCGNRIAELLMVPNQQAVRASVAEGERYDSVTPPPAAPVAQPTNTTVNVTIPVVSPVQQVAQQPYQQQYYPQEPAIIVLDVSGGRGHGGGYSGGYGGQHRSRGGGYQQQQQPVLNTTNVYGACSFSNNSCNNTINTTTTNTTNRGGRGWRGNPGNPGSGPPIYNPPPPPYGGGPTYTPPPPPIYNNPGNPGYRPPGEPIYGGGGNTTPGYTPPGSGGSYSGPGGPSGNGGYNPPGPGAGYSGPGEPIPGGGGGGSYVPPSGLRSSPVYSGGNQGRQQAQRALPQQQQANYPAAKSFSQRNFQGSNGGGQRMQQAPRQNGQRRRN